MAEGGGGGRAGWRAVLCVGMMGCGRKCSACEKATRKPSTGLGLRSEWKTSQGGRGGLCGEGGASPTALGGSAVFGGVVCVNLWDVFWGGGSVWILDL